VYRRPASKKASALREAAAEQVENEIVEEKAASLTRAGRRVEAALAAIRAFDAGEKPGADRGALLNEAAGAVWALLIQHELSGFRNEKRTIEQYGIPQEVMARVGRM
jgi:cell division protein ZapA (FtsZ GTPase activity inhibitor)